MLINSCFCYLVGNRQQQQQQLNLATLMSQASGANAGTFSLQNALQQTTLQQKQQQPQLPSFGIAALQFTVINQLMHLWSYCKHLIIVLVL